MMYLIVGKLPDFAIYRCYNEYNLEQIDHDYYFQIKLCYQVGDIEAKAPMDMFRNILDFKYLRYNSSMILYDRLKEVQVLLIKRIFT